MKSTSTKRLYEIFKAHPIISKDSRKLPTNCLYFALKGENFDGNKFAKEALKKGAAYAVVDDYSLENNNQLLFVDDVLTALQDLANYHRNKFDFPVIAITGSNGKTTSKELIAAALSPKYKIAVTKGNYNNHIGVPLTLLSISEGHELAIIEMGANHQGEINMLCQIANPTHGLITNIGKAHLEGFGGVEGILKGKTELFRHLEKVNGTAYINLDDEKIAENIPATRTITFSTRKTADCRGTLETTHPELKGTWQMGKQGGTIESSLYGEYNFSNILAACCIASTFEVEEKKIDLAIASYHSEMNRSQLIQQGSLTIYLDAYNANPTSMGLSLENFEKVEAKHKTAILGDMFELGNDAAKEHEVIILKAEKCNTITQCVFVGSNFYKLKDTSKKAQFFKTTQEAKDWFLKQNLENVTLLLKGSRGMALEELLK